ncbi:NAD-dependent epimerase/dehydratase family protein [Candidatus Pelagibacter sp.]|nr:NAD-dependent epimerase/dehydratase family protein [Candidatus Pelagibacter sp.]
MKICVVTGSNGLVGSESVRFFSSKKFKVVGIDNNLRKFFFGKNGDTTWVKKKLNNELKNYTHYNYDIRDKNKISNIFKKYSKDIKIIIHCAAQPSHDWAYQNPQLDFETNANGTLNLLQNFHKYCPKSVFINLSTNKVYGDNPNKLNLIEKKLRYELPKKHEYFYGIDEKMSIQNCVHSLFGVSKLSADLMVQEYGKNFSLKTVSFRAGCLTGPMHSSAELHGFLSFLVKQIINKKKYKIFGYKGKQVRDNLHSFDLVNAFWNFYKSPRYGEIYNIGGSRKSNCSVLEAIEIIEKLSGIKANFSVLKDNRVGDHKWWISNVKKFKKHYPNWMIKYNIEKVIKDILTIQK